MQNKHQQKFHFKVDQLPGRGGGPPVGPKDQLFPFLNFEGSPKSVLGLLTLSDAQGVVSLKLKYRIYKLQ